MGGKKSGGGGHTPKEAPDSLRSAQKLRAIGVISLGPIKGPANKWKDTYFDSTPIQNANGKDDNDVSSFNYKNTEIQYNLGYQDQAPLEGFESSEREVSVGAEVKQQHEITRSVIDPDVTRLRLTIGVNALVSQNDKGDTNGTSVDFQVLINGSPRGTYQISGKSSSRFYRSYIIDNLPERPFTVTVKRLTADSTSQRLQNGTHWVSYTEIIDTKLNYPNMAIVGIKTDSRYNPNFPNVNFLLYGRIIKIPTTYDPEARTYAPGIWKGDWKLGWTNNPAWIFYDLVTDKLAGLGQRIGDFGVDKFQLYEIAKYCDELVDDGYGGKEPRMVSNLWITDQRDAYSVISDMASVFRAIAVWDGTQITAIQDRPSDPVCLYTQSNIINGKITRQYAAGKTIFTAVEVEYADERNLYQKTVEYVADDSMIARYGYNVKKMTAYGCTSRGQAHRYGKWVLETSRLEQCTITFAVGRQGLMHLPGDIIEVADNNYAGKVLGGRVIAIDGNRVTLDQSVEIKGDSYLSYLNDDFKMTKVKIKSVDKQNPAIVELDNVPNGLSETDNWVLKTGTVSTQLYRAIGITENDDGSYTITALQHEPQKEAIVDGSASFMPVATTAHGAGLAQVSNIELTTDGSEITLSFNTPIGFIGHGLKYQVKLYRNGNLFNIYDDLTEPYLAFNGLVDGNYIAEIRSKNFAGQLSDPVTKTFNVNFTVTELIAVSKVMGIELNWHNPVVAAPNAAIEIWVSLDNNFINARKLVTLAYPTNSYSYTGLGAADRYWFWARMVGKDVTGEFTPAVEGVTDRNASKIVDYIHGQITKSELSGELIKELSNTNALAAQANSGASLAQGRAAQAIKQIEAESAKLAKQITTESLKASQALQAEIQTRGTAVQKLEELNKQQAKTLSQVTAKADSALSGLEAEKTARVNADKAEAKAREILTAKLNQNESFITDVSQALTDEINARTIWQNQANSRFGAAESNIANVQRSIASNTQSINEVSQNLNSKIDGLSVGGRNYLLDSTFSQKKWHFSQGNANTRATCIVEDGVVTISSTNTTWKQYQLSGYNFDGGTNLLEDRAKVTISFEVMTPDDNSNGVIKYWMNLRADRNNGEPSTNPIVMAQAIAPSKWTRVSVTGIAVQPTNIKGWRFILAISTAGTVKFRKPKLELGTISTDWTPAPEDVEGDIEKVSADLTAYKSTQATKEQATATQLNGLTTRVGSAESKATNAEKSISALNTSTATKFNQLEASLNNAKSDLGAKITAEQTARANADKANAEQLKTLASTVNGAKAEVSAVSKTMSDVNGKLTATHTIKTQAISGGRTAIAGISLGAGNNGKELESSVIVMADKFSVVKNANDGQIKPIFSIVHGKTALNGDLIADGSIIGKHIRANTEISAPIITGGTVKGTVIEGANINGNTITGGVIKGARLEGVNGVFTGTLEVSQIIGAALIESITIDTFKRSSRTGGGGLEHLAVVNIAASKSRRKITINRGYFITNNTYSLAKQARNEMQVLSGFDAITDKTETNITSFILPEHRTLKFMLRDFSGNTNNIIIESVIVSTRSTTITCS